MRQAEIAGCACRFPILLTMAHLTIGFFVLSPFMTLPYFAKQHAPTLKAQWKGISCVGAFKVIPSHPSRGTVGMHSHALSPSYIQDAFRYAQSAAVT